MEDRALDDYKLKLDYLRAQFDRSLSRFNYFLTVEMALFGFLGWLLFEKPNSSAAWLAAALGLFVSVLWYVVAAQDRALVQSYRNRADRSAAKLGHEFSSDHPAAAVSSHWKSPLSWYWEPLSVTRVPVYSALAAGSIWLSALIWALACACR